MVRFEKLADEGGLTLARKVAAIAVAEGQIQFAGTAMGFLASREEGVDRYAIVVDGKAVGFFKLDRTYPQEMAFCPSDGLGLRAFVIDWYEQGKGLGAQAARALHGFVKETYPGVGSIYLTVNCKNPAAIRAYEKAGFVDTGELYLGGPAGPQHVMKMELASELDKDKLPVLPV